MALPSQQPNATDLELQQPPTDGISSLSFNPCFSFLAASSWDSKVYYYQVDPQTRQNALRGQQQHNQPALCCCWSIDGYKLFSGSCDRTVKVLDVQSGQSMQIGMHDQPIKEIRALPNSHPVVVTGSWDKTLRYWDLRQQQPAMAVQLTDKLYAMDVQGTLLVAGTADKNISIFNLQQPQQPYKTIKSPLKYQTRCVACFPNQAGFIVGSIEGRCGVHHVDDSLVKENFAFKCHRENPPQNSTQPTKVYAVNDISFHPRFGTFATCGADGGCNFWDKDHRQRLKPLYKLQEPISACCFDYTSGGTIFAYAASYDWSMGVQHYTPQKPNKIFLHQVPDSEVQPKRRQN